MRLRDGIGTLSLDGRLRRACLPGLAGEECRYVYFYASLPNLLLSLHPDYVMTHTLWPRGVDRTEIVCEWLFHPEAMAAPGFDPDDAVAFWDLTNRQDWHVCEQMQLGLNSRAYRPGPYSHREELLYGFDQLIVELERQAAAASNAGVIGAVILSAFTRRGRWPRRGIRRERPRRRPLGRGRRAGDRRNYAVPRRRAVKLSGAVSRQRSQSMQVTST